MYINAAHVQHEWSTTVKATNKTLLWHRYVIYAIGKHANTVALTCRTRVHQLFVTS